MEAAHTRPRATTRPFVGREREMDELGRALDAAVAGRGRLVLLVGEPGIGKSRTTEELAARADARGAEVLLGRCYEDEGAPALWPWTQIIRAYARGRGDAELGVAFGAEVAEIAQIAPELRARVPGPPAPPSSDPQAARFRLFDGIATFLDRTARARPIVLVLDDLQGADQPSLLLLRFLARGLRAVPLLIVGTFRDAALTRGDPLAETLGELLREPVTTRLSLRGFTATEIARFVEAATGLAPLPSLITRIHERTDGNPFFVGEIVHWLAESGQLERPQPGIEIAIPEGVRAAVAGRLGRLSDECAGMLRLACGFGREFQGEAVARASGLDAETLAALLTEALDARLIGPVVDRPGRYRFAHALTRDTLYADVPAPERPALHLRLAEALEGAAATDGDAPLAEIGAHFLAAGDRRGVEYVRRAGDRALEMLAYEEAARQYGIALPALEDGTPADEETRCDLLLALAQAQNHAGDRTAAQQTASRAAESARARGARDQLSQAALAFAPRFLWGDNQHVDPALVTLLEEAVAAWGNDEAPLHAKVLARLAAALCYSAGAASRRTQLSQHAVAMARRLGDRAGLIYALHARHFAMWVPGNAETRLAVVTELIHLAEAAGDDEMAFQGHYWRFWDLLDLGNPAALEVELEACARLAEARDPQQSWQIIALRATRSMITGRHEEIDAFVAELQALGERWVQTTTRTLMGQIMWRAAHQRGNAGGLLGLFQVAFAMMQPMPPVGSCIIATLCADAGRMDEARAEYASFIPDGLAKLPEDWNRTLALILLAEACQALGDDPGAVVLYRALEPYAYQCVTNLGFFGAAALYLGMLATMQRRWTEATHHFEHGLAVHERLGAAPWLARTRYEYAAMLVARANAGDLERAGALLAAALPAAAALSMDGLLVKVKALIARVADRTARTTATAAEPPVAGAADGGVDAGTTPRPNVFRREGEYWTLAYADAAVRLRDAKGLHYLAHLLAHPARDIHVADLATLGLGVGDGGRDLEGLTVEDDLGAVLDPRATAEYRRRLAGLRTEIDDATATGDVGRADHARHETELIARALLAAHGLGGRVRRAGDPAERVRKAVTNRIRKALERIDAAHPVLGRHLANAVRTGFACAYRPEHVVEWQT